MSEVTRDELEHAMEKAEERSLVEMGRLGKDVKAELRWLVLASVGLNQVFNNLDLSAVASGGILAALFAGAIVVKGAAWAFFVR